jgi:hypothetical protein
MTRTSHSLSVRALTSARTRGDCAQRHRRKARLQLNTLEDRVTPVTVTIAPLADAIEGGTATFRVSRVSLPKTLAA